MNSNGHKPLFPKQCDEPCPYCQHLNRGCAEVINTELELIIATPSNTGVHRTIVFWVRDGQGNRKFLEVPIEDIKPFLN